MSVDGNIDTDIVDISEFFSGGTISDSGNGDQEEQKSTFGEVDSPIKELKAIILSLDWEITDELADSFVDEVDRLSEIWNNDPTVLSFLKILRAVGKYLRTHKAEAHPDSIKLLYSVYNNFEKLVLTDEISPDQEKEILAHELDKFKDLKEKIALAAAAASEGKANEHLLSALKSIVLEISWDITDTTISKFNIEINKLEKIWSADKTFLTALQMMKAIGSYIQKNKLDSHPDSIKLLHSIFNNFEQMALDETMSQESRQQMVDKEMQNFADLKKQISASKTVKKEEKVDITAEVLFDNQGRAIEDEAEPPAASIPPAGEVAEQMPPGMMAAEAAPTESSEVENRLDALFDDGDDDAGMEMEVVPLDIGNDEVAPLPPAGGFDQSAPPAGDLSEVTPLEMTTEEVTPLPAGGFDETPSPDPELSEVVPLEMSTDEVAPLPAAALEEQAPETEDDEQSEVVPLEMGEPEVEPLPPAQVEPLPPAGAALEVDGLPPTPDVEPLPPAEDVESLPPAGDVESLPPAGELGEIVPMAEDTDVVLEFEDGGETAGDTAIDAHLDNFFGDDDEQEEVQPLPGSGQGEAQLEALHKHISGLSLTAGPPQVEPIKNEIALLEQGATANPQVLPLLGVISSLTGYIETVGTKAHPDSLALIKDCAASLDVLLAEESDAGQEPHLIVHQQMQAFFDFLQNILLPSLSEMTTKVEEIRKILNTTG